MTLPTPNPLRPTLMGTLIQWCAQNQMEFRIWKNTIIFDVNNKHFPQQLELEPLDDTNRAFSVGYHEIGLCSVWQEELTEPTDLLALLNHLLPERGDEEGRR